MRVIAITLGFVPSRIWEKSVYEFYRTKNPDLKIEHYFVDQHYPVSRETNRRELQNIVERYGIIWLDPGKNLGLHEGWNWAVSQIKPGSDDILLGYDPDSHPVSPGWDMALVTAVLGKNVVWASLMNERSKRDIESKGYEVDQIGHIYVWRPNIAVMNSICAWRASWLEQVGGLHEPLAYYGLLECAMFEKLTRQQKWVFVRDWWEKDSFRFEHDIEYVKYKWAHAHLRTWPGDFESFIAAGCPVDDPPPDTLP